MQFYILIFFISLTLLLLINLILKKANFSLDKEILNEKHKSLLNISSMTPLSGTIFFSPVIILLFFESNFFAISICLLLFLLGFLADLKIIGSYKLRLFFQFLFLSILFFLNKDLLITTRIELIDYLNEHEIIRILLCTFFFMVLINGCNLIDGANCLCSLNFLIVCIFIYLLINLSNINFFNVELLILIVILAAFCLLNLFGKNFLGDGAAYGLSFLIGYLLLKISIINNNISPYFIANLLWYPAFENLFSILRRAFTKKNNYLPDTDHLHQLLFKFYKKKLNKKIFFLSSLTGVTINLLLIPGYVIGLKNFHQTTTQVSIILIYIFIYLISYYILKKLINGKNY